MHVTNASGLNIGSSTRPDEGVVVHEVTDFARKLQEKEWLGRNKRRELHHCRSLVLLVFKVVHSQVVLGSLDSGVLHKSPWHKICASKSDVGDVVA